MKQLKFGIAGYGKMGKIREISILESNDAELISIYDITNPEHHNNGVIFCDTYEELLKTDIDVVIVSAYVSVAAEYVIRALNAGKHVFCEKPPSMTSKEMLEVIEVEKRTGKILKYGFNHRFHYSVMEAKKLSMMVVLVIFYGCAEYMEKLAVLIFMTIGEIISTILEVVFYWIRVYICLIFIDILLVKSLNA